MAQTHDDKQHKISEITGEQWENRLQELAKKMRDAKESQIASGLGEEKQIAPPFLSAKNVNVIWLPEDELVINRVSCGGGRHLPKPADYCIFRGNIDDCIEQLRISLASLRQYKAILKTLTADEKKPQ